MNDKTLRYMRKQIKGYKKELRIKERKLKKESDLVKVDDTWIKLAKMMFEPFRLNFRNERVEQYNASNPELYLTKTLIQIQKKRDITIRAGEMIFTYLEIESDPFLYHRASGDPTIVDSYDPI